MRCWSRRPAASRQRSSLLPALAARGHGLSPAARARARDRVRPDRRDVRGGRGRVRRLRPRARLRARVAVRDRRPQAARQPAPRSRRGVRAPWRSDTSRWCSRTMTSRASRSSRRWATAQPRAAAGRAAGDAARGGTRARARRALLRRDRRRAALLGGRRAPARAPRPAPASENDWRRRHERIRRSATPAARTASRGAPGCEARRTRPAPLRRRPRGRGHALRPRRRQRRWLALIAIPLVFVAAAAAAKIVTQSGESPENVLFNRVLGVRPADRRRAA